jgi:hypothetical protein
LKKLRAEASAVEKQEPKLKWQDALGVVGVLLAIGGIAEMPLKFRVFCFVAANISLVVSFWGHVKWPTMWRWTSSGIVTVVFVFVITLVQITIRFVKENKAEHLLA